MKLPPLLIAGSLLANLTLAAVLFSRAWSVSSSSRDSLLTLSTNPLPKTAAPPVESPPWSVLESAEPADLIARLRAEGFPPAVVRAIARQLVRDHFLARHQALAAADGARPYWTREGRDAPDPKINAERRALNHDTKAMLQSMLGADEMQPTSDEIAALQHRFGSLPPAKLVQLQKIVADYTELSKETSEVANSILLPQDRATLALIRKESDADAARLLSDDELTEYELHHSSTANRLQQQLSAFEPTEEEFRALFTINRVIDTEYGNPGVLSPEQRRARIEAQKQLTSEIQAALGPERFAAYQQATDPTYQQAYELVTRLELPKEAASQVVAVQKDIQQRLAAIRFDPGLSSEQRQVQLAALQQEATLKLTSSLGAHGLAAYRDNGGYWLQNLQLQAAPKAAPKP